MSGPATPAEAAGFAGSRDRFESLVGFLAGDQAGSLTHHELESRLQTDGRELLRGLFQDHLDLRAGRETRIDTVADAKGVGYVAVEPGHTRSLTTVFGEVTVNRRVYRHRALNLPEGIHSFGLGKLAAVEASKGSFAEAQAAVAPATGALPGGRTT